MSQPHNSQTSLTPSNNTSNPSEPDLDAIAHEMYRRGYGRRRAAVSPGVAVGIPGPAVPRGWGERQRTELLRVPWGRWPPSEGVGGRGLGERERARKGSVVSSGWESDGSESGVDGEGEGREGRKAEVEDGRAAGGGTAWMDPRFAWKRGVPHHPFSPEVAPYPLSYAYNLLDHQTADVENSVRIRAGVTYHVFDPGEEPRTCLDVGCGTGRWVIQAAEAWPECSFVGIDIAPALQPKISKKSPLYHRVRWVECNFVTDPLPFDDETFDHVHVWSIAGGVPEKRYFDLFEEMHRVLRPGGTFEMLEDDMVFPNFVKAPDSPRSSGSLELSISTSAADTPSLSVSSSEATAVSSAAPALPNRVTTAELLGLPEEHDHSLLETLFYDVYRNRDIGPEPTAVLSLPLGSFLEDVKMTPALVFPAQPFIPPQPFNPARRLEVQPRMPRYDSDGLSTLTGGDLHNLSQDQFLPNEEFRAQHMVNALHMIGPMSIAHVLGMREAMWEEYAKMRETDKRARAARRRERDEIRRRQAQRQTEIDEPPPTMDLLDEGSSNAKKEDLIMHHAELVKKEVERDLDRMVQLDRLDRAARARESRMKARRKGGDEIVVDRVNLNAPANVVGGAVDPAQLTDVTLVAGEHGTFEHTERDEFDMLMDRYERDMRYRTNYTQLIAEFLHHPEPRMPITAEELEWQKRFQETLANTDDTDLVWRRTMMYTAKKTYRRLGTKRAA